jgi:hypothetical protein
MEQNLNFWLVMAILTAHFLGDFVAQTDWQSRNKWQSRRALLTHTFNYTLVLMVPALIFELGSDWLILNFIAHTATDAVTSLGTHYFANQDPPQWHNFFVVVGFDQLIHYATLFGSLILLGVT